MSCHVQFLQLNRPKSIREYKGLFKEHKSVVPIACPAEEKAPEGEDSGPRFGSLWHGVPERLCTVEESSLEKLLSSTVKQKKATQRLFQCERHQHSFCTVRI